MFLRHSAGVPTYILFCQYKTCLKCLYHSATKFFLVYPISICSKWFLHCLEGNYNPFQIAFSTKHLILLAVTLNSPVSKSSILAILHKFPGQSSLDDPVCIFCFYTFLISEHHFHALKSNLQHSSLLRLALIHLWESPDSKMTCVKHNYTSLSNILKEEITSIWFINETLE